MSSSLRTRAINSSTVAISNSVERFRVVVEYLVDRGAWQLGEPLARGRHRIDEAFGVRIVRPDEEAIVPRKIHHQWKHPLVGVGADPDITREVFTRRTLHLRGMPHVLEAIVEPLDPFADPAGHRFDGRDSQLGESLQHAFV